ncbi:DNA translocase FtsK [Planococcus sp. N028]|uniref:DNA translocase FtsK n=1 Tax=Planococcus shixiaomingii TaxID=3058393 RepID=A0ABT8MX54_9BACL|nr:DNA translocase FtsK [Planococcus sp. N028]MDN7240204.1 DNA translocase FtsK [Planococcus sp. N028]
MSWVKNIWNRMFPDDIEEENTEVEWEQAPVQRAEPTPFRFPLIPDDEKEVFLKRDAQLVKVEPHLQRKTPQPIEPLTREPAIPPTYKPVVKPAHKPIGASTSKPEVPSTRTPQSSTPKITNKTRRFEPTQVPSPVYGFSEARTKPLENLPERRENHFKPKYLPEPMSLRNPVQNQQFPKNENSGVGQNPVLEQKSNVEEPSLVQEPAIHEKSSVSTESMIHNDAVLSQEPVLQDAQIVTKEPVTEETTVLKQEPAVEEVPVLEAGPISEETPELIQEPFAKETTVLAQEPAAAEAPVLVQEFADQEVLAEPQEPIKEDNENPEDLEQTVHKPIPEPQKEPERTIPVQDKKKEKTVPFNVLMLKSDKQRMKKTVPPVTVKPAEQKREELTPQEPKKAEEMSLPVQIHSEAAKPAEEIPSPEIEVPVEKAEEKPSVYLHPESSFLLAPENGRTDDSWMEEQGERLIEALSHFHIQASILSIVQGPAVTQFELTVAQGVKVSKIRNLADDLKLALAAKDIRIQAPIPGKSSIGIEIPNRTSRAVRISEIIDSPVFRESESPMEAALGLDLTGKPVTLDLRKMPHGLIAGATGSGKSVCINSILVSLLYKSSPRDLKLLLIDPKMVELAPYNHIPHLVSPVITDVKAATASLKWAVEEMERRYQLFAHTGVRDISRYNKMVKEKGDHAQHLPYILIIIDELADLMMMSPSDVEDAICRIAQKARACGIHLVIATQRPSVDVITGLIKSNIPTRIAFSVSSQVDSRTILDSQGAERLLGRGDMLYLGNGMSAPVRLQGTFVTDEEIETIIEHVREQGKPEYFFKEEELLKKSASPGEQDDFFEEACRFILAQGTASTSLLQRKFHIGYNRAARLMDLLEQQGFISEQNGSKARSVLITAEDMKEVFQ